MTAAQKLRLSSPVRKSRLTRRSILRRAAKIQSRSHDLLNTVAETLSDFEQIENIEVQGHTDSRGDEAYNLDLSQRRADAVAYLIEQGVDSSRLESRGYGKPSPSIQVKIERLGQRIAGLSLSS